MFQDWFLSCVVSTLLLSNIFVFLLSTKGLLLSSTSPMPHSCRIRILVKCSGPWSDFLLKGNLLLATLSKQMASPMPSKPYLFPHASLVSFGSLKVLPGGSLRSTPSRSGTLHSPQLFIRARSNFQAKCHRKMVSLETRHLFLYDFLKITPPFWPSD